MTPLKSYIADCMVGKRFRFKCDCLLNIDVVGVVKGWNINNGEILWNILTDDKKVIRIGENHPNMYIEEL